MALNALSLSTTQGQQGRPFSATISGQSAGSFIDVGVDGAPGFYVANGKVYSDGLPYPVSTLVLREILPGTGLRETRIPIAAAAAFSAVGSSLSASAAGYLAGISQGALIASLNDPFSGQGLGTTTYATFGTVPGQLALQNGTIVAGATAAVAGNNYSIGVRATSGDGKQDVGQTLSFTVSSVSVTPTLSLTGPLAYTTSSPQGSTTVATVGGLATGETVSSVNVPQLAVSGANIVVGLGTQTVGNLAFVVTTSTGRTIGGTAVVTVSGAIKALLLSGKAINADRMPSGSSIGVFTGLEAGATLSLSSNGGGAVSLTGNELFVGSTPPSTRQNTAISVTKTLANGMTSTTNFNIDGPVPPVANDNFAGAAGTALDGRTTTTGAKTWSATTASFFQLDGSGNVKPTGTTHGVKAVFDTGSADHTIYANCASYISGSTIANLACLVARYQDANNYYRAECDGRYARINLYVAISGTEYLIGQYAYVSTSGQVVQMGLRARGGDITVLLNGQELFSHSCVYPTATQAGIFVGSTSNNGTNYCSWSNLAVSTPAGPNVQWPNFTNNNVATPDIPNGASGSYDYGDANGPSIAYDPVNSRYVMTYAGYRTRGTGGDNIQNLCVAYATSDLGPWTKDPLNPVLLANTDDGYYAMNGGLIWHAPTSLWIITYASSNGGTVNYATSPDLHNWTRRGIIFAANATGTWYAGGAFDSNIRLLEDGRIECVVSANNGGSASSNRYNFGRAFGTVNNDGSVNWVINPTADVAPPVYGVGKLFNDLPTEPCYISPPGEPQQIYCTFDAYKSTSTGTTQQRIIQGAASFDGGKTWRYRIEQVAAGGGGWMAGMTIDSFPYIRPDGTLAMYHGGTPTVNGAFLGIQIEIGGSMSTLQFTTLAA